jgi:hypothetical protein
MSIVVICVVAVLTCGAIVALAMARVAARADEELDELLARRLGRASARGLQQDYVRLSPARRTISREPSRTQRT